MQQLSTPDKLEKIPVPYACVRLAFILQPLRILRLTKVGVHPD